MVRCRRGSDGQWTVSRRFLRDHRSRLCAVLPATERSITTPRGRYRSAIRVRKLNQPAPSRSNSRNSAE